MLRLTIATVTVVVIVATSSPCLAQAQIFRVGPDGEYATIGAALSELLAAPHLNNWIKVEAGVTTLEHLSIPATWTTGTIWLSGGWGSSFLQQSDNQTDTVISGWTGNSVINVTMAGGTLIISDLTIMNGAADAGAGLRIQPTNDSHIRLDNLQISNNTASSSGSVEGGGVCARLRDTSVLDIASCDIHHNIAAGTDPGAEAFGAGIHLTATGSSVFSITGSAIHDNTGDSEVQVGGTGVYVSLADNADGVMTDCVIDGNISSNTVPISISGAGLRGDAFGPVRLDVERTRVTSNTADFITSSHEQVVFYLGGDSVVSISDSIVTDGLSDGLAMVAGDGSAALATNLTVAANAGDGLRFSHVGAGSSNMYLSNTISYLNGGMDLKIDQSTVIQTANLIGVDPEFVDIQDLDFRFEAGSVAEDGGSIEPPGGLGVADIRGGIRILGPAPDVGAYEGNANLLFSGGFEADWLGHWSNVVGLPIW